jgi:hypothetical protein
MVELIMGKYLGPWLVLALGVVACKGGDTAEDVIPPQISGTLQVNDSDYEGEMDVQKVFTFATNGQGVAFFSPNPDATCDEVVGVLQDTDYDPINVYAPGKCTLGLRFYYDNATGFDGIVVDKSNVRNVVNVNCGMGEGTWERVRGSRGWGYEYSGMWWQGGAKDFTYTVTGTNNVPTFDLDLGPGFHGQFTYDDTLPDPATGSLKGQVDVISCQKLVQTNLYE